MCLPIFSICPAGFDHHSSGQLVSRVTYHVEQVAGAATKAVTIILREGLFVVGLVLYLLWTNWLLTLLFGRDSDYCRGSELC